MKYLTKNTQQNPAKILNFWSESFMIKPSYDCSPPPASPKKQKQTDVYGTIKGKARKELNKYSITLSRKIAGIIAEEYIRDTGKDKITKQIVLDAQNIAKAVASSLNNEFTEKWRESLPIITEVVKEKTQEVLNSSRE